MKPRFNPLLRISAAVALACAIHANAADISFSSSTPLTFTDTQSYDNGTVVRIGEGTGTVVNFNSGADYTFSGNLTLTGAWNRITLNTGASLTVDGTIDMDISGVSLNGGTLTTGELRLEDNPNWAGSLWDGKQWVEYGDSVINGSTIVANQSNANFIRMGTTSGFSVNWFQIGSDGATIDSDVYTIGNTMNTWGSGGLTKTGSGTLSLTANNAFTGNTLVSNGVLEVTSTGKLYGGGYTTGPTITVASGGTLRLNGWSWDAAGSIANLDYSRDRLVVNGGTIEYTGNSNFNPGDPGSSSRNLTIGTGGATLKASSTSGQTWTIHSANGNLINNNGLTLDGAGAGEMQKVIEGSGSVTKTGTGIWTLSGANTYNGNTTVSTGTLALSGSGSIASSSNLIVNGTLDVTGISSGTFTVGTSQTLSGSGTVNASGKTLSIEGTHAVGSSPGQQDVTGNLSYASGSVFEWDLAANVDGTGTRGTDFDAVDVSSDLTIDSAATFKVIQNAGVDFTNAFWDNNQTWSNIWNVTGTTTSGWSNAAVAVYNTSNILQDVSTYGYFTISGTGLNWTAVPEPTSALAGLLLAAGLLRRRRAVG
jgi:autotransporter-associated beta strand protein